jgi:hydrogenase-1 operon protein HyaF
MPCLRVQVDFLTRHFANEPDGRRDWDDEKMKELSMRVAPAGAVVNPEKGRRQEDLAGAHDTTDFELPTSQVAALAGARDVLAAFLAKLDGWNPIKEANGPRSDLVGVAEDVKESIDQMLGEGEVSVQIAGESTWRIKESVFTGMWRCCHFNAARALVADWLEAAPLPRIVLAAARVTARLPLVSAKMPPGVLNAPALIREITSQVAAHRPGGRAHVINLTLLPMTTEDQLALERAFPPGPVAITSHGFGNCRITSTTSRDVWRVQYFNNAGTLILNTIEVVDVPEIALASAEDLMDSRARLAELVMWMGESASDRVED